MSKNEDQSVNGIDTKTDIRPAVNKHPNGEDGAKQGSTDVDRDRMTSVDVFTDAQTIIERVMGMTRDTTTAHRILEIASKGLVGGFRSSLDSRWQAQY